MSWSTSPTTGKKNQPVTSTAQQSNATTDGVETLVGAEEEVVVPIVIWEGVPQIEVSCLHVLYLPMSQPSQNSSTAHRRRSTGSTGSARIPASTNASNRASVKNTGLRLLLSDDEDSDEDEDEAETYQICVFAGTIDGAIFYWSFEQDAVVQVNMLLFESSIGTRGPSSVQSIVSGIDEWGQSMLISITRDGAIARWQLPNGHCSYGNASLAKQLAPIKGMEMFCNNHYAMVYSQESRMMVLDTLKMTLLYCMDTAQEQVRRSIAVGELKVPTFRVTSQSTVGKQNGGNCNSIRTVDPQGDSSVSSPSSLISLQSSTNSSAFNNYKSPVATSNATYVWDSLVLSLGSEGLVKCFLWAKPRNGTGVPSYTGNGTGPSQFGGFQWIQESCWVISWADDADDITCSQSTSLKDVDNMNPQTALMRSIKESYFPSALHVSPDSSLVLFIWKTKWVVLKRKWLCKIGSSGSGSKQPSKSKTRVRVGSCRIPPSSLLGSSSSAVGESTMPDIFWDNGAFLADNQLVLWTNTGHVIQFPTCGSSMTSGGKLFIFTKDQDQFVPRSNHKNLAIIEHGNFVAFMKQCECCSSEAEHKISNLRPWQSNSTTAGFTTRAMPLPTPGYAKSSDAASSSFRLFHMCSRGSFGCWTLPSSQFSSPPRMSKSTTLPVHVYDRVKFHSLAEGFGDIQLSRKENEFREEARREVCVSHIMLGRDISSSSAYDRSTNRVYRRKRREPLNRLLGSSSKPSLTGFSAPSTTPIASNALSSALGPIALRPPPHITSTMPTRAIEDISASMARHLMDVPLFAKGFSDGDIEFGLLGNMQMPFMETNDVAEVRISCHHGKVTAIAHCSWVAAPYSNDSSYSFSMLQTTASGIRKGKAANNTSSVDDSSLASDKNPFYRSRFQPTAFQKRSHSSRHMSIIGGDHMNFNIPQSLSAPSSPKQRASLSHKSEVYSTNVHFMVFSGGQDGILKVIELTLRPFDATFHCEAIILQQFRKHRGAIKDISISPPTRDSHSTTFPERFVATIGIDNKVAVYAPLYSQNPNGRGLFAGSTSKGHCGIEWECILELCDHNDVICRLDWHLERGLLYVECEDRMLHVWNIDTGILERSLPTAMIYDGGNPVQDGAVTQSSSNLSVDCDSFAIGGFVLHLLNYNVMKSAEYIKQSWRVYFYALTTIGNTSLDSYEAGSVASPYAIGSIELLLLSFLLSWGATSEIDRACRELLGLDTPQMLYSCALRDPVSGALTVPLPWKSVEKIQSPNSLTSTTRSRPNFFARNWQHSSALSATLALGIISLSMNLMEHKYSKLNSRGMTIDDEKGRISALILPTSPRNKEEFHVLWSQLITQHSVVLPDYVPLFREPALEFLARFGFHSCDYTQLAARTLLSGVIKRLEPTLRSALTAEYSTKLHCELVRLEMETGCKFSGSATSGGLDFPLVVSRLGSLVILLSMIGTCYPGEISPAGAREVCDVLVFLLKANAQFVASVSAELLTKGLMLFRPHLVDLSSLICQLLLIDMREKQRNPNSDGSPQFGSNARVLANGGSNAALSLLVELGACETAFVLTLLQQEMHNAERSHAFRECVLLYLTELINAHYLLMYRHLPAVVDTIMCCLDPTKPERRKRCLELSTRCLHNLVRRFPMVDFHKETQRLAIGTMEAVIFIYDLRTATKWRVLDGHTAAISAVAFRQIDGHMLVSYAAREGSVRWWNSGNAGLFGGMLKMQQSCLKEHKLELLKSIASAPSSSGGASADLKQVIQTCRFQFLTLAEKSPFGEQKEKKVLRLTREDASQVQFLL